MGFVAAACPDDSVIREAASLAVRALRLRAGQGTRAYDTRSLRSTPIASTPRVRSPTGHSAPGCDCAGAVAERRSALPLAAGALRNRSEGEPGAPSLCPMHSRMQDGASATSCEPFETAARGVVSTRSRIRNALPRLPSGECPALSVPSTPPHRSRRTSAPAVRIVHYPATGATALAARHIADRRDLRVAQRSPRTRQTQREAS